MTSSATRNARKSLKFFLAGRRDGMGNAEGRVIDSH